MIINIETKFYDLGSGYLVSGIPLCNTKCDVVHGYSFICTPDGSDLTLSFRFLAVVDIVLSNGITCMAQKSQCKNSNHRDSIKLKIPVATHSSKWRHGGPTLDGSHQKFSTPTPHFPVFFRGFNVVDTNYKLLIFQSIYTNCICNFAHERRKLKEDKCVTGET